MCKTRSDDSAERIREFRIAIMDEIKAIFENSPFVHRDIPGNLFHPGFIGMWRDPGALHEAANCSLAPSAITGAAGLITLKPH
jgi:hypothetical protein